jgi:hypothetical protein
LPSSSGKDFGIVGGANLLTVGVVVGEGFATITPLFQTNFLPDLIHVNFLPTTTEVMPAFVHAAPALAVALLEICG